MKSEQSNHHLAAGPLQDTRNNKRENRFPQTENPSKRLRSTHSIISSAPSAYTSPIADSGIEDRSEIFHPQPRNADLFTCLPSEVITHVLSYLPMRDRKSVRLACRTLNECSRHISIAKREKIVFPGSRAVSRAQICKILLRTNYAHLNLEFYGTGQIIRNLPVDVWRVCGDRVRSLHFICSLKTRVLVDIFRNCGNLQVFGCRGHPFVRDGGFHLRRTLDILIELNVVCTKLHTLTFHACSIDTDLLLKIFTVFPNLKHLHATFEDLRTDECLKLFRKLRGLTYIPDVSTPSYSWLAYETASRLPMRLMEFCMILHDSDLKSDADACWNCLLRFLAAQNQLEKLSLTVLLSTTNEFEFGPLQSGRRKQLLMFHALRSCTNLRKFQFSSSEMCFESADEVSEFLALISNLRRLKLESLPRVPDGLLLLSDASFALNMLVVSSSAGSKELLLYILKHSPRMQELMIAGDLTIRIFKEILRNMPKLRTLSLCGEIIGDEFSSTNVLDDDCHIDGLENLEYLELWLSPFEALPAIDKIHFRCMKHVKLVFRTPCCEHGYMNVHKVLRNMPTVETIELPQLKLEDWHEYYIDLFRHLKNLRRFVCWKVDLHKLKLLFKVCPSLKFVSARRKNQRYTFSFNSSARRVIREPLLTLEKQGYGYRVDEL